MYYRYISEASSTNGVNMLLKPMQCVKQEKSSGSHSVYQPPHLWHQEGEGIYKYTRSGISDISRLRTDEKFLFE